MKRPNGSGTAFKRGNYWYAQVTSYCVSEEVDGVQKVTQRRKTKGGFRTKREALNYIAVLQNADEKKTPRLIDLWSRIEKTDVPKLSRAKQSAYNMARKRIEAIIGKHIDEVTLEDMQKCVDENADSFYTARDMKTLLTKMYDRCIPDGFVNANIARYISLPDLAESEPVPFSEEEIKTMWEHYLSGDEFVGYMLIMIYTGMMPVELLSCRTEMINYSKQEIIGCGRKTAKRKETPIVFAECVSPVLHAVSDGKEMLCGMEKTKFYKLYHEATVRIGVRDLPPYACRHTTATEAAKKSANPQALKELMRHARITTTQRYIHLSSAEAHDIAETMFQPVANTVANT